MSHRHGSQSVELPSQLLNVRLQLRIRLAQLSAFGSHVLGLLALALSAFGGCDFILFAQDLFFSFGGLGGCCGCVAVAVGRVVVGFLEIAGFDVALVCCVAGSVGCFAFELEVSFFVEVVVWYLGGFFGRCGFGCCGACFGGVVSTGGAWSRRLIRFWGHVHRVDCGRTQIKLVVGRILICESRHCVCEAEAGVQIACAEWRREVRGHDIGIAVGYSVAIRFPAKVHVDVLSVSISQQYLFFWPR